MSYPFKKNNKVFTNAFRKILNGSDCNPNKMWVNKGSEFYNRSTKSWLQKGERNIFST